MTANTITTFSRLDRVANAQRRHVVRDWVAGCLVALGMLFGIAAIESSAQALTTISSPRGSKPAAVSTTSSSVSATAALPTPCPCSCDDLPSC